MLINRIRSNPFSLGWWSSAALSRLNGVDGETRGDDSRKTGNCNIKPRIGLGMNWGESKNLRVLYFEELCAISPPAEEKVVQLQGY